MKFNRRDLLQLLLGGAVAAVGRRRAPAPKVHDDDSTIVEDVWTHRPSAIMHPNGEMTIDVADGPWPPGSRAAGGFAWGDEHGAVRIKPTGERGEFLLGLVTGVELLAIGVTRYTIQISGIIDLPSTSPVRR